MNLVPPSLRRVLAIVGLGVAFIIMASIFVPGDIGADDGERFAPHTSTSGQHESPPLPSADPHDGLEAIGSIENVDYLVIIYATDGGPRYTIYEADTGREVGTLLRVEQVEKHFPDLPISSLQFGRPTQLMLAPPDHNRPDR